MTIRITPHAFAQTIEFIKSYHLRKLKQLITDVQNPDHAHYKKYSIVRPLLGAAYRESDAELNGIRHLVLEQKKWREDIKTAKRDLHDEWQLHDFQIIALQRPGTKPPFFIKEAA